MNRLLAPLLVFVVWIALWGELSWANLFSGVVVVALIGWLIRPVPRAHVVHPLGLAKLLAVFAGRLVTSSVSVVLTVLHPTPARLRSGVVSVRLRHDSELVATIVADAISLTPGTLTLDAVTDDDSVVLQVHVLGLGDPEEVRSDIRRLEATVLAAVRPRSTLEVAP
ncbi:MAG: Na+/H+ antiporter subunit E [Microthrixaceae bacterium]|nr:Na+/H+ antiporter subunit E [Microthrixaceae bacterium]MCO5318633.1 Na+/H+ antiporter subunit E [Microthrixaceae bacterium]